jgi:hypothetical protein
MITHIVSIVSWCGLRSCLTCYDVRNRCRCCFSLCFSPVFSVAGVGSVGSWWWGRWWCWRVAGVGSVFSLGFVLACSLSHLIKDCNEICGDKTYIVTIIFWGWFWGSFTSYDFRCGISISTVFAVASIWSIGSWWRWRWRGWGVAGVGSVFALC